MDNGLLGRIHFMPYFCWLLYFFALFFLQLFYTMVILAFDTWNLMQ